MSKFRSAVKNYFNKKLPLEDERELAKEVGLFSRLHLIVTQIENRGFIYKVLLWVGLIILGVIIGIGYAGLSLEDYTIEEMIRISSSHESIRYLGDGAAESIDPTRDWSRTGYIQVNLFYYYINRLTVSVFLIIIIFWVFRKYYKSTEIGSDKAHVY